jgi:hypothetical protein
MPTDASAGDSRDSSRQDTLPDEHDELTFATHDLRRERPQPSAGEDLGFAPADRPGESPVAEDAIFFVPGGRQAAAVPPAPPNPPMPVSPVSPGPPRALAPADSFVIREAHVAPAFPVDALVVGAAAAGEAPVHQGLAASIQDRPFQVSSFTRPAAPDPGAELPWTVRDPDAGSDRAPSLVRRGWSSRRSSVPDPTAAAAILRLREEAVDVSWKAAWIAVTTADPRLARKRRS